MIGDSQTADLRQRLLSNLRFENCHWNISLSLNGDNTSYVKSGLGLLTGEHPFDELCVKSYDVDIDNERVQIIEQVRRQPIEVIDINFGRVLMMWRFEAQRLDVAAFAKGCHERANTVVPCFLKI